MRNFHVVPEEYTTYFRSIIAFGKIHINEKEMKNAIELAKTRRQITHSVVQG